LVNLNPKEYLQMIQRKQTLFLFQSVFLGIALLFVPSAHLQTNSGDVPVYLVKVASTEFQSSIGHVAAILINFIAIVLASLTVFIYKRRQLQIKLCYTVLAMWLVLGGMTALCPFVNSVNGAPVVLSINYFSTLICAVGAVAIWFAAKFIKKDIDLLKSADRIR